MHRLPQTFHLAAHVLRFADKEPDRIALVRVAPHGKLEEWSFGRLAAAVYGTAARLSGLGVRPGDRVLLRIGNTIDFPVVFLAVTVAGGVPAIASATLTVPEITALANDIRPAHVVVAPGVSQPDGAWPRIPLGDLAKSSNLAPLSPKPGDPHRPGYIVTTSGTSGRPQAVLHAHRAIWARQSMVDGWYGLRHDDRVLHAGAFNWTYTLGTGLLDPWAAGATAIIPESAESQDLPGLIQRHCATIFASAPGVYRQMLRHWTGASDALRHGLSAGEKLADPIRSDWESKTGTAIHEAFGMSECSTFVSGAPRRPAPAGAIGYPQPGRRINALDPDHGPGRTGTLAIATDDPGLMLGYLTDGVLDTLPVSGPWFPTGDRVEIREDGAVSYLGREDDMMNAGGFRVSPLEVEAALADHPEIRDAAAIEFAVKETASIIVACYVAETVLDEAALSSHMSERLAPYKLPRRFIHMDALPRGANGKLLRRALRREVRDDQA
ncbi:MAG: class I adenylate-forming enzyme family protein [Pseudomonadota bacterium]